MGFLRVGVRSFFGSVNVKVELEMNLDSGLDVYFWFPDFTMLVYLQYRGLN